MKRNAAFERGPFFVGWQGKWQGQARNVLRGAADCYWPKPSPPGRRIARLPPMKRRSLLIAVLLGLTALAPGSSATAKSPYPRLEIRTSGLRMDRHYRMRMRVRCTSPKRGRICSGVTWLTTGRGAPGFPVSPIFDGVPVTRLHRFKLGANKERAIRLSLISYARPNRSTFRNPNKRRFHVVLNGDPPVESDKRWVVLRWGR
jgi:hypothetical protein